VKKKLKLVNIWRSYRQKVDCMVHFVRVVTTLLNDEEFARHLENGEKQLLLTVVTPILAQYTLQV